MLNITSNFRKGWIYFTATLILSISIENEYSKLIYRVPAYSVMRFKGDLEIQKLRVSRDTCQLYRYLSYFYVILCKIIENIVEKGVSPWLTSKFVWNTDFFFLHHLLKINVVYIFMCIFFFNPSIIRIRSPSWLHLVFLSVYCMSYWTSLKIENLTQELSSSLWQQNKLLWGRGWKERDLFGVVFYQEFRFPSTLYNPRTSLLVRIRVRFF